MGADVAQSQYRRPVGDYGYGVADGRVIVEPGRILLDDPADVGNARRVNLAELFDGSQPDTAGHADLTALVDLQNVFQLRLCFTTHVA